MKKGTRVKAVWGSTIGTSKGPKFSYGIWWILVEWDDGTESVVLEQSLEVVDENR